MGFCFCPVKSPDASTPRSRCRMAALESRRGSRAISEFCDRYAAERSLRQRLRVRRWFEKFRYRVAERGKEIDFRLSSVVPLVHYRRGMLVLTLWSRG